MKVTSYLLPVLVLVVSIVGILAARDQSATLRMLVGACSGLDVELGGMELSNKDLNTEATAIAKSRSESLKSNETSTLEFTNAREEMEGVKKSADEQATEIESLRDSVAVAEKEREARAEERAKIQETLRTIPGLENSDLTSAVDDLRTKVQEGATEYTSLSEDRDKFAARRGELQKEVADKEMELAGKNKINHQFMQTYLRNGEDFAIAAVDPQWHFVVFRAPADSGIFPGDASVLIVQRNGVAITTLRVVSVNNGQVVAEYDEQKLPRGVVPEVGDRVFRKAVQGS